jgi:hypothetical protein
MMETSFEDAAWTFGMLTENQCRKLVAAEIRLQSSLCDLMTRWYAIEHVPIMTIALKLDIGIRAVRKLIAHFDLTQHAGANKKCHRKNSHVRNLFPDNMG